MKPAPSWTACSAGLSDTQMRAQGTLEHWAFKDMLFHIAFWTQTHADRLAAFRRGEKVEVLDPFLKVNDRVFEETKNGSLEEALEKVDRAYDNLKAEIDLLSEDDLQSTEKYPWTDKRSLVGALYGEGFSHPLTHFAWYQIEQGRVDEARRLNERIAETTIALDDSPYRQGVAAYNLGCFYALAGEPEHAIGIT